MIVRPQDNRFAMPDLTFGLRGTMRRMYLIRNIRDDDQLYWVCVAKPLETITQVAVIKVVNPACQKAQCQSVNTGMKFRVQTVNKKGWYKYRGRPRPVCWDRTVMFRMARALERGADRMTCISALHSPPWCITNVFDEQQYDAVITWSVM